MLMLYGSMLYVWQYVQELLCVVDATVTMGQ